MHVVGRDRPLALCVHRADRRAGRPRRGPPAYPLRPPGRRRGGSATPASARRGVRPRQRDRQSALGPRQSPARDRQRRQVVPGCAGGVARPRDRSEPGERSGPGALQGRHDLAPRADRAPALRYRLRRASIRGGETCLPRGSGGEDPLRPAGGRAPSNRRQDRGNRGGAAAFGHPARPCHRGPGGRGTAPAAGRGRRCSRRSRRRDPGSDRGQRGGDRSFTDPHPFLLLRLSPQPLDQDPGGQHRPVRNRLSRHGHLVRSIYDAADPHGGGGGQLDRHRAIHRRGARISESRRRDLQPFGTARHSRRVKRRREHHLQDSVQRRGGDDEWAAGRG